MKGRESSWYLSGNISRFKGKLRRCRKRRVFGFDSSAAGVCTELVGDIEFVGMKNGKPTTILVKDVLYVPEMGDLTLISEGVLDDANYSNIGKRGVKRFYDNQGKLSFDAIKTPKDGLYHCAKETIGSCYLSSSHLMSYQEAHEKFGHWSNETLKSLGAFEQPKVKCRACKIAKSTSRYFSKESASEAPTVAHTIVTDVHMMNEYSNKGNRYILTFIDKNSRHLRVYFIKRKSDVTEKTKHFIQWVHTQRGIFPKNILSDGGGEYVTIDLRKHCDSLGINLTHSEAYSPQMNGIAERINRTLEEGATALLLQANLPRNFWEEAINHLVFLKNHVPHSKLGERRPIDEWNAELGETTGLGLWSVKPFGCEAYVHIPKERRPPGKHHIKSKRCIYIGRSTIKQSDLFYNYEEDKIITGYSKYYDTQVFPLNPLKKESRLSVDPHSTSSGSKGTGNGIVIGSSASMVGVSAGSSSASSQGNKSSVSVGNSQGIDIHIVNSNGTNCEHKHLEHNNKNNSQISDDLPHLEHPTPQRPIIQNRGVEEKSIDDSKVDDIDQKIDEEKEVEHEYIVKRILKKRKSKFGANKTKGIDMRGKHTKHQGVDYLVEWEEDFVGQWGKDKIQWVRDIDIQTEEIITDYERSQSQKFDKDESYESDERQEDHNIFEEKERDKTHEEKEENDENKQKKIDESEQSSDDEIKAFLGKIENEKLTDRNIKDREDYQHFIAAKQEEIDNAFNTGTFVPVSKENIPKNTKIYNMMWVHKIKPETKLEKQRYRSRLCVLGNRQDETSYSETFAAVAKVKMFRMLLSISVFFGLRMTQIDISNAFMYADLDRDMYVYPPPGYEHLGFLKLNKSLYGLKQAPRLWYDTVSEVLTRDLGFTQTKSDTCCFTSPVGRCYVLIYVDDICVFTNDEKLRQQILDVLRKKFKLRNFDNDKSGIYLGLELEWSKDGSRVKVFQQTFIEKLLKVFRMDKVHAEDTPAKSNVTLSKKDTNTGNKDRPYRSLVGALLYTLGSRPDVAAAVRKCSQYMAEGADSHWEAAKQVLRYLKGTKEKGVIYAREEKFTLKAFCDSDWGTDVDDRKSITGYVIYAQGGAIVWKSKKQPTVARSSAEAEYVSLADTVSELLWILMALRELGVTVEGEIPIFIDNQAAQAMAANPVNHERTKHIDVAYHFIREVVKSGVVTLYYVNTKNNISDLLTKSTKRVDFQRLVGYLVQS